MPFPARIDLSTLGSDGFIIQGDVAEDRAGRSVSNAGDINGDGYDDLIVGAPYGDDSGDSAGEAYVIFGKAGGAGTVDLTGLAPPDGFIIRGDADSDLAGWSVSGAGDVNGDGYDDLIVGARFGDDGGTNSGEAYVIFGKAGGFADIDLGALDPADGFIIQGDQNDDQAGFSVSAAGDVNGDGFDDILVGAPYSDGVYGGDAGKAYVIFGQAGGFTNIDLGALNPTDGFVMQAAASPYAAGFSVSGTGDINGDGYDDLIVSAPRAGDGDDNRYNAGEAYVIFGKPGGFTDIHLGSLAPPDGFVIKGSLFFDYAGWSVSGAGDVNGDGYDDLIVGARYGDSGGSNAGEAYVIFGKAGGFTNVDLRAPLAPGDGFLIQGDAAGDQGGWSVSGAGDVNGDGFDDLIIGAPFGDDGGDAAGEAYIIFGKASGFTSFDLGALDPADGFVIQGDAAGDNAGFSVSAAGDIDGDGFDELLVGAAFGDDGGTDAGEAYVIFGRSSGSSLFPDIFEIADDLNDRSGGLVVGGYGGGYLGWSVSDAGDINGDGIADIIVGAPNEDTGISYVIYGRLGGIGTIDVSALDLNDGFSISGETSGDIAGWSVSGAGDVNGDGVDDLIVGAIQAGATGRAYVVFGQDGGMGPVDVGALGADEGFTISGADIGDYAGWSVSRAGDVNGDGFADLIVGASQNQDGGNIAGAAYVIFGSDGGLTDIDLAALDPTQGIVITGGDYSLAGFSVSGAGDVNGDGIDDLIVGAPFEYGGSGPPDYVGAAYLIFGRAEADGGLDDIDLTALDPADGIRLVGQFPAAGPDVPPQLTGFSVSGAGDVNGDGFDDLVIGAPLTYSDCGCFFYGASYVVFGAADGLDSIDLTTLTPDQGFAITGFGLDEYLGVSVSGAGDVNGDGFADIIVGAPETFFFYGPGSGYGGGAYVVFGKADGFGPIDFVAGVAPEDGFFIAGANDGDATGQSVSAAGDVNGDGIDDLIVGAPYADSNYGVLGPDAGAAYIIYGRGVSAVDDALATLEDTAISGSLFDDNGSGAEGAAMATPEIVEVNGSSANVGTQISLASGALLTVNADGSYDYDPGGAFDYLSAPGSGASNIPGSDSFTYTLQNGTTATVTITVTGVDTDDVLLGTAAADTLNGGVDADDMSGLDGDDLYFVDNQGDRVIERPAGGVDTVRSAIQYSLPANVENLILTGSGDVNMAGNGGDNRLTGNGGDNLLNGLGGADIMTGGDGDDIYIVDNGGDRALETVNGGTDRVQSSVQYTLLLYVEDLFLTGTADINGAGNSLDNVIHGNSGNNILNGMGGADTMRGGDGNDVYIVDNAGDVVGESNPAGGTDRVQSSVDFTLNLFTEDLYLTGTDDIDGTGNALDNVLNGNNGDNNLDGRAGADTMRGGLGDDTYIVDNAGDVVGESNAAGGGDAVQSSVTFALGNNLEDLALTGVAAIDGTGNALANTLTGNAAANVLRGLGGADSIDGGNGHDSLHGGLGNDVMTGGGGFDGYYFDTALDSANNVDQILDYSVAQDSIFLENAVFTGLAVGALAAGEFNLGSSASEADDRILYDAASGALYFDRDGSGDTYAAVQFATIGAGQPMTANEFTVI